MQTPGGRVKELAIKSRGITGQLLILQVTLKQSIRQGWGWRKEEGFIFLASSPLIQSLSPLQHLGCFSATSGSHQGSQIPHLSKLPGRHGRAAAIHKVHESCLVRPGPGTTEAPVTADEMWFHQNPAPRRLSIQDEAEAGGHVNLGHPERHKNESSMVMFINYEESF